MLDWFKIHLNITWFLGFLIYMISSIPNNLELYLTGCIVYFGICFWVLKMKGRRFWWILIAISVPILTNKKEVVK